jgi:hypothetical protein
VVVAEVVAEVVVEPEVIVPLVMVRAHYNFLVE